MAHDLDEEQYREPRLHEWQLHDWIKENPMEVKEMKLIDVLGKPCPIPVIEAKKALEEDRVAGILVKVDNTVSVQNLKRMAENYGHAFSYAEKAKDNYEVSISKTENSVKVLENEQPVQQVLQNGAGTDKLVVAISKNVMGDGAEELGKILIKGFIYSLTELATPPHAVIFFNSGVDLAVEGANTIDDLKTLERKGVTILSCGTCLNYYELQEKLAVGQVANMYEITQTMASATNTINI